MSLAEQSWCNWDVIQDHARIETSTHIHAHTHTHAHTRTHTHTHTHSRLDMLLDYYQWRLTGLAYLGEIKRQGTVT